MAVYLGGVVLHGHHRDVHGLDALAVVPDLDFIKPVVLLGRVRNTFSW